MKKHNIILKHERSLYPKKKRIDTIVISVTQLCNFKCVMCRCWQSKWSKKYMSDEEIIKTIKKMSNFYELNDCVSITGGEPLLRKNITEIIRTCNEVGFETTLTTNASLLTEKKIINLIDAGLTRFNISLDSLDPEKHDRLRGYPGSYNKVMNTLEILESLNERKPDVIIMPLIMQPNIKEIPEMIEWAESKDIISNISFQVISTPPNYFGPDWSKNIEFKDLIITNKSQIEETIFKITEYKNKGYKVGNKLEQLQNFKFYLIKLMHHNFGICYIDKNFVFIDEFGMVRVCPYKNPISNIKMKNISEILKKPYPPSLIKHIRECSVNCNSRINCSTPR